MRKDLEEIFEHYKGNIKVSLIFGIMLIFVIMLIQFSNIFITSGSVFLDYNFIYANPFILLFEVILMVVAIALFSFFLTVLIFDVRKEMSPIKIEYYMKDMVRKFTTRIFMFYLIYSAAIAVWTAIFVNLNPLFPGIYIFGAFVSLIVSLLFVFVPQTIVIEEERLRNAVTSNFDFIKKNPRAYFNVLLVSTAMIMIIPVIEFLFDFLFYSGRFIALLATLLFVIPFIEIYKSHLYMLKFDLVKSTHRMRAHEHSFEKSEEDEEVIEIRPNVQEKQSEYHP